jgi:hypothetical protein
MAGAALGPGGTGPFEPRAWLLITFGPMLASMANTWTILTLTGLCLSFLSGCLGDALPAGAPEGPADPRPAPDQAPAKAPEKACSTDTNNYGTAMTVGGTYVFTGRGGNVLVVYEESNGMRGLQTEEECPTPDTKLAEVPYPVALKA